MELVLVSAHSENRVIGRNGGLPWHLPADLAHFKQLTLHRTVIMGRKTYESMLVEPTTVANRSQPSTPLPHRRILVLTRQADYRAPGVEVAPDLDAALALAAGEELVCILGGEAVYRLALPRARRAWLTRVHAVVEGDTRFPELAADEWRLVSSREHPADAANAYGMSFEQWERVRPALA